MKPPMDCARASLEIEKVRLTETKRIKFDPQYSVYTAELIIAEVNAAMHNAAHAVLWADEMDRANGDV